MGAQGSAQGGDSAHRFYISSPFLGLQKEREEAKQLITRQNHAYGDSYGWLLLPHERAVEIWRGGQRGRAERLENTSWLEGGELAAGLALNLQEIWAI